MIGPIFRFGIRIFSVLIGRLKIMANISRFLFLTFRLLNAIVISSHRLLLFSQPGDKGCHKMGTVCYVCATLTLSSYNPNVNGTSVVECVK